MLKIAFFWGFKNDNILSSKSNTVTKSEISPQRKLESLRNYISALTLINKCLHSQENFQLNSFLLTYRYSLWTLRSSQLMQVPSSLVIF